MSPAYLGPPAVNFAAFIIVAVVLPSVKAGTFYYPVAEGLKFDNQDTLNVTYASDYVHPVLYIYCKENSSPDDIRTEGTYNDVPAKDGSTLVKLDYDIDADQCWVNVRDSENQSDDLGFNSVIFSLSSKDRSKGEKTFGPDPTTTTSRASSATSLPTTTATGGSQGASETNSPKEDDDSSGGGLSSGAKAGIGVGVALGALAALGVVAFWLLRRRKSRQAIPQTEPVADADNGDLRPKVELEAQAPPAELAG